MSDCYEIEFLDVASKKGGDAIPLRYTINDVTRIHVVDGGFQDTGDKILKHIEKYDEVLCVIDAALVHGDPRQHFARNGESNRHHPNPSRNSPRIHRFLRARKKHAGRLGGTSHANSGS